ncbi:MAG: LLM class flavin-dependent oxidoreductase [Chloroflexota bacterium]
MQSVALGINNCHPVSDVLAALTEAEGLGAEAAFVSEDINCRDAFQLAALAARQTDRIRLATGVVNPYTRNPTSLAMSIATLDEISRGRAILGLGTSSPGLIQDQMGIRPGSGIVVLREATTIVRALLAGGPVTYEGRYFSYHDAQLEAKPVQPRIPIYFAAMGPKTLELAGELADGVLLNVGASPEYVRWAVEKITQGAGRAGRDPHEITVAAWLAIYLGTGEAPLRRARRLMARMLSVPRQGELLLDHSGMTDDGLLVRLRQSYQAYPERGDVEAAATQIPEGLAERATLVGTVHEVTDRIQQYREAGVNLPVMGVGPLRSLYQG